MNSGPDDELKSYKYKSRAMLEKDKHQPQPGNPIFVILMIYDWFIKYKMVVIRKWYQQILN